MITKRIFPVVVAVIAAAVPASAAERAGETLRVQSDSYQKSGAYPFNLRRGDEVYRDADVWTREHGAIEVLFDDGTDLSLGPNTEITIDEYVYSPGGGGKAAISFGKGVLRMVSGTMPKEGVSIATPVATVGIRGTTFTLAIPAPDLLQGWVQDGTVTATPSQAGQTYAFTAPAAFVCTAGGCEQVDGSTTPPAIFPPPGPGFGFGPRDRADPDTSDDHDDSSSNF